MRTFIEAVAAGLGAALSVVAINIGNTPEEAIELLARMAARLMEL